MGKLLLFDLLNSCIFLMFIFGWVCCTKSRVMKVVLSCNLLLKKFGNNMLYIWHSRRNLEYENF